MYLPYALDPIDGYVSAQLGLEELGHMFRLSMQIDVKFWEIYPHSLVSNCEINKIDCISNQGPFCLNYHRHLLVMICGGSSLKRFRSSYHYTWIVFDNKYSYSFQQSCVTRSKLQNCKRMLCKLFSDLRCRRERDGRWGILDQ
jgi:hypothetical protein